MILYTGRVPYSVTVSNMSPPPQGQQSKTQKHVCTWRGSGLIYPSITNHCYWHASLSSGFRMRSIVHPTRATGSIVLEVKLKECSTQSGLMSTRWVTQQSTVLINETRSASICARTLPLTANNGWQRHICLICKSVYPEEDSRIKDLQQRSNRHTYTSTL